MRNIVIAVVVSTVVVGGVLLVFLGDKSASPVIPPEPAAGVDQAKPADLAPGARRVQTVPATPKELVRLEVAVVNDKNEPVANARVRIDSEEALKSGRRNPAPVAEFLTNASGLGAPKDKLLVGTYVVWAEASGYARARKVATLVKGEEPVKVVITLASVIATFPGPSALSSPANTLARSSRPRSHDTTKAPPGYTPCPAHRTS